MGTVEITGVIEFTQQSWEELQNEHLSSSLYSFSKKGWKLNNPQSLNGLLTAFSSLASWIPLPIR